MKAEPLAQHEWLHRLVGEWTCEIECQMGPDQPPSISRGTESVRSLGGLWTIGEGANEAGEGEEPMRSVMTLGYDPAQGAFVGSFVASMMTHFWIYRGGLDADGRVLTLDAEGPGLAGEPSAKYQDSIEFVDDRTRILRSRYLGGDGNWTSFMTARYTRKD